MSSKRNETKVKNTILLTLALVISFLLGVISPIEVFKKDKKEAEVLTEVYGLLKDHWYYGEDEKIIDRALDGMVSNGLDKFTYVMDPGSSIMGDYYAVGMGVSVTDYGGYLLVTKVLSNSPAEAAGLKKYDVIKKMTINEIEHDFSDKTYTEVTSLLQFSYLDEVSLKIDRIVDGTKEEKTIDLIISEFTANTVECIESNENYFMISISEFGAYTTSEFKRIFKDRLNSNAETLIIDLRDNPGGYVDTVVSIASLFLPKNAKIMGFEYRDGSKEYEIDDDGVTYHFDNIYIMVNENSASGAEALTISLKENASLMNSDVYVVGQNTYGKGSAQKDYILSNDYILHMTFALWLGPNGTTINKVGVAPTLGYEIEIDNYSKTYFNWTENLKLHDKSNNVLALQYALDILDKEVYLSGYFDKATEDAVKEIQNEYGLTQTGVVDLATFNIIRRAVVDKEYEHYEKETTQVVDWILNG